MFLELRLLAVEIGGPDVDGEDGYMPPRDRKEYAWRNPLTLLEECEMPFPYGDIDLKVYADLHFEGPLAVTNRAHMDFDEYTRLLLVHALSAAEPRAPAAKKRTGGNQASIEVLARFPWLELEDFV